MDYNPTINHRFHFIFILILFKKKPNISFPRLTKKKKTLKKQLIFILLNNYSKKVTGCLQSIEQKLINLISQMNELYFGGFILNNTLYFYLFKVFTYNNNNMTMNNDLLLF